MDTLVKRAELVVYALLLAAAAFVLYPLAPWLMLALWAAHLTAPIHKRVKKLVRGSGRAAAVIVTCLTILMIAPLVLVAVSLARDAVDLGNKLMASEGGRSALASLVSNGDHNDVATIEGGPAQAVAFLRNHGDRAWQLASALIGAATSAIIGLFMFLYGTYALLVNGRRVYAWAERTLPVQPQNLRRFGDAFHETGRGLFIGVGVTGLVQAVAATITFAVLDVPRALVLGLLTFIASILPSFGTALVWVPVAAGLAVTGRTGAAIALTVVGIGVIGTIDNILRPFISHKGDAHLPVFVLMVGMFGGLATIGAWGLLLGPLVLRLAIEAMTVAREQRHVAGIAPLVW